MADVYVLDKHNNLIPSMTREEIFAAIQTAAEGGSLEGFNNCSFVTRVKEINKNADFGFWVGTQAEYNAISTREKNVLYLISDSAPRGEIVTTLNALRQEVGSYAELVNTLRESVASHNEQVGKYAEAVEKASGRMGEIETLLTETNELIKEVAPQVIFEKAEGTTNALTTKAVTEFREIKILYEITDTEETITRRYEQNFAVADIVEDVWLYACYGYAYPDLRKTIVGTAARVKIANQASASSVVIIDKTTNVWMEMNDYSNRYAVSIIKIYGIGAKKGA